MSEGPDVLTDKIDTMTSSFTLHVEENTEAHRRMAAEMVVMTRALDAHMEEEAKLHKAVFGNGAIGMSEELRNINRFQNSIKRSLWILVPAAVIGAVSMVANAAIMYMKASV